MTSPMTSHRGDGPPTLLSAFGNEHYRGRAFGWIVLVLFGCLDLFRGSVHTFKSDGGAARVGSHGCLRPNEGESRPRDSRRSPDLPAHEARGTAATARTEDHREAVRAIVEKRKPSFRGF